jgi:enoyl-CoA hydratase/carnithine racemase
MPYGTYESITVDVDSGIANIEFHRPEKLNALNNAVMLDLQRAFGEISVDEEIEAVVLSGEGTEAFSAGADITQYAGPAADHDPYQRHRQDLFYEVYRAPLDCHAPTVAKIDGYCVGGGLILAMYCDMRVATEESSFGVPTANIGQIPTGGSTRRTVDLVGEAKAKELMLTAGYVDAAEAERIGLLNHAVPSDELDAAVAGITEAIGDTGREAVKASKRAINDATEAPDLESARAHEAELWWEQFATEERRDLVEAFNED